MLKESVKTMVTFSTGEASRTGLLSYTLANGNMLVIVVENGKRAMWEVPASHETGRYTIQRKETGHAPQPATS